MEQMEKVIEIIRECPEKGVGLKLTSMVDIVIEDQRKNFNEAPNTDSKSAVILIFMFKIIFSTQFNIREIIQILLCK